jgi:hypothetical protein
MAFSRIFYLPFYITFHSNSPLVPFSFSFLFLIFSIFVLLYYLLDSSVTDDDNNDNFILYKLCGGRTR